MAEITHKAPDGDLSGPTQVSLDGDVSERVCLSLFLIKTIPCASVGYTVCVFLPSFLLFSFPFFSSLSLALALSVSPFLRLPPSAVFCQRLANQINFRWELAVPGSRSVTMEKSLWPGPWSASLRGPAAATHNSHPAVVCLLHAR